jgi:hypothetical protein
MRALARRLLRALRGRRENKAQMKMHRCTRCEGFVPLDAETCPNCSAMKRWWMAPLAFAGAGLATVTLSACYGPGCVSTITKPDGSTVQGFSCAGDYDCRTATHDQTWNMNCLDATDAGADAGTDAGTNPDAGNPDGGP